ncbi:MAG: Plug domain-containing protein, partial [Pseudomonadota bacterium]
MNKITIAATIAVAANFANFSTASAQAPAATTSDDELTQLLGEVEAPAPSAPATSTPSEAAATPEAAAPAEASAAPTEAATDAAPAVAASATDPAAATAAATPADATAPVDAAATAPTDSSTPAAAAAPVDPAAASAENAALYDVIELPKKEKKVPVTPEPRRAGMIEEVIVTAQRREESLQEVPMSITVLDAKQMSNANITNASDLATYTPSMSTNQRFGADNATFSIRGFTQELRTTSSVATYMAEVVAPRGQSSQTSGDGAGPGALFDLANVQVLKGPQGTLFGRNTTGGAVLLTPNKPKDEFEGYVEVSGSQRNGMRAQGAVSI